LYTVLYGVWTSNYVASNGNALRDLSAQFLTLAEKQKATAPLLIAHRIMGISLAFAGELEKSRAHFDHTVALYVPSEHRPLATRFSVDSAVSCFSYRSWVLWLLGRPEAALADADQAVGDARQLGQAATLMYALWHASITQIECGNYAKAGMQLEEVAALAEEKGASFWTALATMGQGWLLALTGDAFKATPLITSGIAALQSAGGRILLAVHLLWLARACAELGQFDDAWRKIGEAKATEEQWWQSEVTRMAGEIALLEPKRDTTKAEMYFEHSLSVARQQQAKSWELRASMSLARLWRDQGKVEQARELLAPVYGWFTEGFDTRDLKEAKLLLNGLQ
jgi:predicted ATPase